MINLSNEKLSKTAENLRTTISKGDKIMLIKMVGEEHMPTGLEGIIDFIDDARQIHVDWENGSTLTVSFFEDTFQIRKEKKNV